MAVKQILLNCKPSWWASTSLCNWSYTLHLCFGVKKAVSSSQEHSTFYTGRVAHKLMSTKSAAPTGVKPCKNFIMNLQTGLACCKCIESNGLKLLLAPAETGVIFKTRDKNTGGVSARSENTAPVTQAKGNKWGFQLFHHTDLQESVSELCVYMNHHELVSFPTTTSPLAISLKLPSSFPVTPHLCQVVGQENWLVTLFFQSETVIEKQSSQMKRATSPRLLSSEVQHRKDCGYWCSPGKGLK